MRFRSRPDIARYPQLDLLALALALALILALALALALTLTRYFELEPVAWRGRGVARRGGNTAYYSRAGPTEDLEQEHALAIPYVGAHPSELPRESSPS